jgi:HD-GYP domain-containing protein (c-di-GMP phosphodiesterase class II)
MLSALEAHHPPTYQHSMRTARLARRLGEAMAVTGLELDTLEDAAALHDVGKLTIPARLLNLTGELQPSEYRTFRWSIEQGHRLIACADGLEAAGAIVLAVHERFDGSGYPFQLVGHAIPLSSRIVAVADAFDSMTRREWGRSRLTIEAALRELAACAGTQFDSSVVDVLRFVAASKRTNRTQPAGVVTARPWPDPDAPLGPAA